MCDDFFEEDFEFEDDYDGEIEDHFDCEDSLSCSSEPSPSPTDECEDFCFGDDLADFMILGGFIGFMEEEMHTRRRWLAAHLSLGME